MIEIRFNGRRVLTTTQAAELLGVKPGSLRARASREGITPTAHLDPRTPLWNPEDLGIHLQDHPVARGLMALIEQYGAASIRAAADRSLATRLELGNLKHRISSALDALGIDMEERREIRP